jgi:hypothetical protein
MKHKRNVLGIALVAPVLLAFSAREETIEFHPRAGSKLHKTFEISTETTLDEMRQVMNGQEPPGGDLEMENKIHLEIAVTDEYGPIADGRPTTITRTYDEIGSTTAMSMSHPVMGSQSGEIEGSSELEGKQVLFTWNEGEGGYTVSAVSEGMDDDLIAGLAEDMDLRGFLPDKEVAEGSSWDVDVKAVRGLFAPGGSIKVEADMDESDLMRNMGGPPPSPDEFLGEFEGTASAKLSSIRDEGGVRVAVIDLIVDVSSAKDLTEYMAEVMDRISGNEDMPDMEMDVQSMDVEYSFRGQGTLLWNLDADVVHGLDLSGSLEQITDTAMNMSAGGMDIAMEMSMTFSGTQRIKVSTEHPGN